MVEKNQTPSTEKVSEEKGIIGWLIRFFKGALIGTGAILPGVSGGALAAAFGIYERVISFLANIRKNFVKNILYFIPLGLGLLAGIFFLSFPVTFLLKHYEAYVLWFFIGCIVGTLPMLYKDAGKKKREKKHIVILVVSAVLAYLLMFGIEKLGDGAEISQNFFTWLLSGAIIGLGMIVPGLSSSNFLLFFGMYTDMTEGIKELNFGVIIPLIIGVALCVLILAKLMDFILKRYYTTMFHIIIGVVIASTVMIIPLDFNYLNFQTLILIPLFALGYALGYFMEKLDLKYS